MKDILLVGIGGFVGAVARYKLGGVILYATMQEHFPYSTFSVNLLGCLGIGVLAGLAEHHDMLDHDLRLLLFTGLMGGFTTFSAFGLDALHLLRRGELPTALLYITGSILFGLAAVWLGLKLTR